MPDFMAENGLQVLRNGYNIIPIKIGEKAPAIDGFLEIKTTEKDVRKWSANGMAACGIGITTGHIVFVDIDVPNRAARRLLQWALHHLGFAPVRIGNAPKLGLMYRSETPLPTRLSTIYYDRRGRRCRIELLGLGRQFVAYHIHPETGKPYIWDKGYNPLETRFEDLPVVTMEQLLQIFSYLDQVAIEEGWTRGSGQLTTVQRGPLDDLRNPKKPPCGYPEEKIREILMSVPNDNRFDAREDWMNIGFAVHHETGGSEFGRELWYGWSEQHSSHRDELFEKAWRSFGTHADDSNYPDLTFRYVVKIAGIIAKEEAKKQLDDLFFSVDTATGFEGLKKAGEAAALIKDLEPLDRERLVAVIQQAARRMGSPLSLRAVRDLVRYRVGDTEVPEWLRGWVFLTHTGQFYSQSTGQYVDRGAFDTAYGRYVGEDTTPTWVATRVAKIPVYHMTMYLPGAEATFRDVSGLDWVNTYRDTSPPIPEEYSPRDIRNIEIIKAHAVHLFGEDQRRDIDILHSTLAYTVQTGKRVNWLTVIQGAEGIGKTAYSYLMSAVLGGEPHVYQLDSDTLTGSNFTEWAQGHQFVYIEELKVHGKRYDVLDKMKPYITNDVVSVHPKGLRQYNAVNTTTYLAFTNHRDAVPLTEGDTRYFIMLSQWQDSEAVDAFKAADPGYYPRLFAAIEESPGAIRRWLLEYELHKDFDPVARAPRSSGKTQIIEEGKSELQTAIEDVIEDGKTAGVSRDLIIVHILRNALADAMNIEQSAQAIFQILRRLQYAPIVGRRVKITEKGERRNFFCWTKNPKIRRMDNQQIREIIEREILPL